MRLARPAVRNSDFGHKPFLLRAGLPIARTAVEAGFYDQAHLSRHFRRIVGIPPGQFTRDGGPGSSSP